MLTSSSMYYVCYNGNDTCLYMAQKLTSHTYRYTMHVPGSLKLISKRLYGEFDELNHVTRN